MSEEIEQESSRKLASVQRVSAIKNIEGADRIEVAFMEGLGWECVVGKADNIKVGDLVVYFEVDVKLPERAEFEFMRERKFKVKTIRLKKQISQGLIVPIDKLFASHNYFVGEDVTGVLGVTNYVKDKENEEEREMSLQEMNKLKVPKFLMNMRWFRYIYLKLNTKVKGSWPTEFAGSKTDETRIQVLAKVLMDNYDKEWYICKKLDGSSSTFFTYFKKEWGIKKKHFGVCSRNIWLKTKNGSTFWKMAEEYKLEEALKGYGSLYSLQGETIGETIQKNKYKLKGLDLYLFNVSKDRVRLSFDEAVYFCKQHNLKFVPIVSDNFVPSKEIGEGKEIQDVVRFMVEYSRGKSKLFNRNREGIVCRLKSNPNISFKVINPDFLLEDKE